MQREKSYSRIIFSTTALQKVVSEIGNIGGKTYKTIFRYLKIENKTESWLYDTFEEFIAQLNFDFSLASVTVEHGELSVQVWMRRDSFSCYSTVTISSENRNSILRIANVLETYANECFVPEPPQEMPKPKIFIGHGNSPQWRDLKDHLHEHHGYEVISYETGSRAGHTIRDVIEDMLDESSFAILVMTGEDPMEGGTMRARQNVIHEIGLFQGILGFTKAIVLKEDGTEEFSNINGVNQIRYTRGNIKETFGEVLAVLKREFGNR